MAGLRSAYETQKWTAIRKVTAVPLQKVLDGIYNPKDIMAIGDAIEQYDELAHSIFTEGVRAMETNAKKRVEAIQEHRTLVRKAPLSAKQLAIIYAQALSHVQDEMMPEIMDGIREILSVRQMQPQPGSNDPLHEATDADAKGPKQPKLKQVGKLERFIPPKAAANEERPRDRKEVFDRLDSLQEEQGDQTSLLELLKELVEGLKEGAQEELQKYKKDIMDIRALVDGKAADVKGKVGGIFKDKDRLAELLEQVEDGQLYSNPETQSLHLSYSNGAGGRHEVVAQTAKVLAAELEKQQARHQGHKETVDQLHKELKDAAFDRGLFGSITRKSKKERELYKKLDGIEKANRKALVRSGEAKETGMEKARRLVSNTKDEFDSIKEYLARKYHAVTSLGGRRASEVGKIALLLAALPFAVTAAWEAFTKDFDFWKFAQDVSSKAIDWVWDKIKSLIGLDRKPRNLDGGETDPKRNGSIAVRQSADEVREGRKIINRDLADGIRMFTPEEAARIEKTYYVKIPKDRIRDTAVAGNAVVGKDGLGAGALSSANAAPVGGSSPASGASSSSIEKAAGLTGAKGNNGSASPVAAATEPKASAPATSAPAAAPTQRSSVAAEPKAAAPADSQIVSGSAAPAKAVTAAPPKVQEQPTPSQQGGGPGVSAGSNPINLASVPNGSHNHDASFALNVKSL